MKYKDGCLYVCEAFKRVTGQIKIRVTKSVWKPDRRFIVGGHYVRKIGEGIKDMSIGEFANWKKQFEKET